MKNGSHILLIHLWVYLVSISLVASTSSGISLFITLNYKTANGPLVQVQQVSERGSYMPVL